MRAKTFGMERKTKILNTTKWVGTGSETGLTRSVGTREHVIRWYIWRNGWQMDPVEYREFWPCPRADQRTDKGNCSGRECTFVGEWRLGMHVLPERMKVRVFFSFQLLASIVHALDVEVGVHKTSCWLARWCWKTAVKRRILYVLDSQWQKTQRLYWNI